jgi:anaerobic magnesium-protoporphyrin IX monomethyl ester cyclase
MRVLFIVRGIEGAEPLGLMYISALLQRHGHDVHFLGTRGVDLPSAVAEFAPHVIGYGMCTGQHRYYLALNRWLKSRRPFLSVFGGPHATFFPQVIDEDGVDVVCRGEGEDAMLDLCRRVETLPGEPPDGPAARQALADTPNLHVKLSAGQICRNPPRPLRTDLDDLPFPDRESRYALDPRHRAYPAQSFLASRGCPYQCSYCFNPAMQNLYGPAWSRRRRRSPENLVQEIAQVRAVSGLRFVQFRCSVFGDDVSWLAEFAPLYRRRIGLPFYCHVRADHMTARAVALLAAAGCRSVNMGLECADEEYRRTVMHRPMPNAVIVEACRRLHDHGIRILADNMVGLPGRALHDDIATLRFNAACGIDYPLAMLFQPYPGTGLGDYAQTHGHFDGDYSHIDFNYYFRSPLRFQSPAEKRRIENLHKLFAVTAEAPWLLPLVRQLIKLPPNAIFNAIFRWWYAWCYHRRIMPHRLNWADLGETLQVLLGIYAKESFDGAHETNQPPGRPADRPGPGRPDRPVPDGLATVQDPA